MGWTICPPHCGQCHRRGRKITEQRKICSVLNWGQILASEEYSASVTGVIKWTLGTLLFPVKENP